MAKHQGEPKISFLETGAVLIQCPKGHIVDCYPMSAPQWPHWAKLPTGSTVTCYVGEGK
jgi:hypothetical protein